MITLMVNVYAEDPTPAIASADLHLPIDREVVLHGRYEGFPDLGGSGDIYPSEHAKRNEMLRLAGKPDSSRWLLWIDCDERVQYASPMLDEQLRRFPGVVAGFRFIDPLPPDRTLVPGIEDPGRRLRDHVLPNMPGRLYRHLPGLEYRGRHDNLYAGELISGWRNRTWQVTPENQVDLEMVHLWWEQPATRKQAKREFYSGPNRILEHQERLSDLDEPAPV